MSNALQDTEMSILFICEHNAIRSPIAEGLLRKTLGETCKIQSCGLINSELDEYMVSVMRERNVDMSDHKFKSLSQLSKTQFDKIIALTEGVKQAAEGVFKTQSIELWLIPNPIIGSLDVRDLLNNYRSVRDLIEKRIKSEFPNTDTN